MENARDFLAIGVIAAGGVCLGALTLVEPGTAVHDGVRAGLCAACAGLLLLRPSRWSRALVVFWAGLVIGGVLSSDVRRVVVNGDIGGWSHYHYRIGAKYFDELGYTDLYEQTLAAFPALKVREVRDLGSYRKVRNDWRTPPRSDAFTDARWQSFRDDLEWFRDTTPWGDVLRDRGFNATPFHTRVHQLLAVTPSSQGGMLFVGLLDIVGLVGVLALLARCVGVVPALTGAAWLCLWVGNHNRLVGFPFQYDYVIALVGMVIAWRWRWYATSGALLGYAAMARVFPGLLLAGLLGWGAGMLWEMRPIPASVLRFGAAVALVCTLGFAVGSTTGRGPGAWGEWTDNMQLHTSNHRFDDKRVGLQHVFTLPVRMDAVGRWPGKKQRRAAWQVNKPVSVAVALLVSGTWLAGTVVAGRRGDDPIEVLAMTFVLVFVGLVASRYYASAAVLLVLTRRSVAAGMLAWLAVIYVGQEVCGDAFGDFWLVNVALLVGTGPLLLSWIRRREACGAWAWPSPSPTRTPTTAGLAPHTSGLPSAAGS